MAAGLCVAVVLWIGQGPAIKFFETWHRFGELAALIVLLAAAGGVYGIIVLAIFGRDWVKRFRAGSRG
jgi:hypothetical protein